MKNAALAQFNGAAHCINYRTENFAEQRRAADRMEKAWTR